MHMLLLLLAADGRLRPRSTSQLFSRTLSPSLPLYAGIEGVYIRGGGSSDVRIVPNVESQPFRTNVPCLVRAWKRMC